MINRVCITVESLGRGTQTPALSTVSNGVEIQNLFIADSCSSVAPAIKNP